MNDLAVAGRIVSIIAHCRSSNTQIHSYAKATVVNRKEIWRQRGNLDILAESFWGRYLQCAFFNVRVFNPFALSYHNTHLAQCQEGMIWKGETHTLSVWEILSMALLVFTTSGAWLGHPCNTGLQRITSTISEKYSKPYSKTMHWILCKLNFSLLGALSLITADNMDLVCSEGRAPSQY